MRGALLVLAALAALAGAEATAASELIDRNATGVQLLVDANGRALLTYRAGGRARRVVVWGAINARPPSRTRRQVNFRKDYSGGAHVGRNACARYDGPALQFFVAGCRAPDGSYWALQSWQRLLPGRGVAPSPRQAAWELRLSHWRGPLAQLTIKLDWAYGKYDHLYGAYSYLGHPVFGFRATRYGSPLDTYGRNLYLDTYNSAYGRGWKREAGFLTHTGRGNFCYGFFARAGRPPGKGERYRATVIGPGVTPDVYWESAAPGPYDRQRDLEANAEQSVLAANSRLCRPN